jgi:hypothetical protein
MEIYDIIDSRDPGHETKSKMFCEFKLKCFHKTLWTDIVDLHAFPKLSNKLHFGAEVAQPVGCSDQVTSCMTWNRFQAGPVIFLFATAPRPALGFTGLPI